MTLKVFISYSKEDRSFALDYFAKISTEGASPWMDDQKLLPGQRWEFEIDRALKDANLIVLLLSPRSVNKRGFVQREAQDAIEQLRYKKEDDIYILPLVIEPCEVPSFISGKLQYIEMTSPDAWGRVQQALALAAEQQQIELQRGSVAGLLRVFPEKLADERPGFPGYEVTIEYPRFASVQVPAAAQELSMFFAGRAAKSLIGWRGKPWEQNAGLFPYEEEFPPSNTLWEGFGIAHSTEKILSLTCNTSYFYAGAAHGNSGFETFTFALEDSVRQLDLQDFFADPDGALQVISKVCIGALCREFWERIGEKPDQGQLDWFTSGAGPEWGNFHAFNVNPDGFTFLFPPYQVSAYAFGTWSADVAFYDLLDYLRPNGPHSLARAQQAT
ncbi:hypothetical protein D3C78_554260 [compost metagenome]